MCVREHAAWNPRPQVHAGIAIGGPRKRVAEGRFGDDFHETAVGCLADYFGGSGALPRRNWYLGRRRRNERKWVAVGPFGDDLFGGTAGYVGVADSLGAILGDFLKFAR